MESFVVLLMLGYLIALVYVFGGFNDLIERRNIINSIRKQRKGND